MSGRVTAVGRVAATRLEDIGDLPGLAWWVEPDSIVATGSAINSWTDKSGAGNTIAETGTNRPTKVAAVLNGFDGVQCVAASSQRLKKLNAPLFPGRAFTLGLVLRVDASIGDQRIFCNGVVGTDGVDVYQNGANYTITYDGVTNQNANAVAVGAFHIFTYRVAGGGASGFYRYDRATQAFGAALGLLKPGAAADLILGARGNLTNHASVTYVAGFISTRCLSDGHVKAAENLWKAKYPSLT